MKRIALKFGTTARVRAFANHAPATSGTVDFSCSPLGPNPPTA